jgi:hypothetical protein
LYFATQEFGTLPPLRALAALREENRWHHYGQMSGQAKIEHPVKRALLEALCPVSSAWRIRVVERGVHLLRAACEWTFERQR